MWHENSTGGSSLYISDDIGIHVDPVNGKWRWFVGNGSESLSGQADTKLQAMGDALLTFMAWLKQTSDSAAAALDNVAAEGRDEYREGWEQAMFDEGWKLTYSSASRSLVWSNGHVTLDDATVERLRQKGITPDTLFENL